MTTSSRGALTIAMIAEVALKIADVEGLDAVSMRRVGAEFGYTGMSLYKYVESKEELLDQTADLAIAALPVVDPQGDWVDEITRFHLAFRDLYLRHPAVAEIMTRRPLVGPNTADRGEAVLNVLLHAGFDEATAVEASIALSSYTLGSALYELSRTRAALGADAKRFPPAVSADRHPAMHRLHDLFVAANATQFSAGLRRLIGTYVPDR